jgi:hypothetical protein
MHEYDSTLKLLLQGLAPRSLREVTGASVAQWLNVELPELEIRGPICSDKPPTAV